MPRKRMLDPSFWRDEKIGQCSFMERLLFEGLWTFAEDTGVGRASPFLLKADIFPYDTLREADIEKSLAKIASLGLILLYETGNQKYYHVVNFNKHQTINRPTPATLPLPLHDHSVSSVGALTTEEKRKEEKIREVKLSIREENSAPLSDFEKAINDFKDHRKSQKSPMTQKAVELMLQKLQQMAGDDDAKKVEIINQSIERGWKGVFDIKDDRKQPKGRYDVLVDAYRKASDEENGCDKGVNANGLLLE